MKKNYQLLLSASLIFAAVTNVYADHGFAGSEHKTIGDRVKVTFPGQSAQPHYMMALENGVNISYGDLVSMGDFFGIVSAPISRGATAEEREQRFRNAFSTVSDDMSLVDQVRGIRKAVHEELDLMTRAMNEGKSPSEYYRTIANNINRQYNCITGGGCGEKTWWMHPGRHLKLEEVNYDHFGNDAWLAYSAGHRVAMHEAVLAKTSGDLTHLRRAYAMNAFACHFLTDRFASGHIRNPRYELAQHVTPSVVGSLLAKFMHDEDSFGLHVHNSVGEHWVAYGDSNYFEPVNAEHKQRLDVAMQKSADEVYAAYENASWIDDPALQNMLPFADEDMTMCGKDTAALFAWDEKSQTMYRRWTLRNMTECSWTKYWLGWSTLAKLAAIKGIPVHVQGQLAQTQYAERAVAEGIITDKDVIEYVRNRHID